MAQARALKSQVVTVLPFDLHLGSKRKFKSTEMSQNCDLSPLFVVSQGNRWMNTIPLSSSLSSRRSATGTSTGKEATGSQHVLKDYLKRRNLILALIRREIERLSTWHNPLARPELSFTGMESLVNWANQTVFTERIWRDLVRLAWHISPDIAVFLPARYVLV